MRAHFCAPITNIKGTVCHNWVKFLYLKFCTYVLSIEFFAQARSPLIWAGQHAGLRGSWICCSRLFLDPCHQLRVHIIIIITHTSSLPMSKTRLIDDDICMVTMMMTVDYQLGVMCGRQGVRHLLPSQPSHHTHTHTNTQWTTQRNTL